MARTPATACRALHRLQSAQPASSAAKGTATPCEHARASWAPLVCAPTRCCVPTTALPPANLDADVFTWWQHPPHLWNHRILAELRLRQLQGSVRMNAVAVFLADRSFAKDMASWRSFEGQFLWQETVKFDEVALCHGLQNRLKSCAFCPSLHESSSH